MRWAATGLRVDLSGAKRRVISDGVPTSPTGTFPVAQTDDANAYDRNPNRILQNDIALDLPAQPAVAAKASCLPMGMIGVTLTGAAIFSALDVGGRDAGAHEVQDTCGGHLQQSGQYRYHGGSPCLASKDGPIGYALDGFGLYAGSEAGKQVTNADLDECHGHVGNVVWDGRTVSMYHYQVPAEYPYSVGCFKGTPRRPTPADRRPQTDARRLTSAD